LSNYQGYTKCELILVFDGFRVKGNPGERFQHHNIHVVYTKEKITADMYIEELVNDIGKNYAVKVVTSDNLIRIAAIRSGVLRISASEFEQDIRHVNEQIRDVINHLQSHS